MTIHAPKWMEVGPPVRAYRRTDQTARCCEHVQRAGGERFGKRQSNYCHVRLRYAFRPRRSKNRYGKAFINFSPAISNKAAKAIRQEVRGWKLHLRSDKPLEGLGRMFNAIIRGWIGYYGAFYKSALYPTLRHLDRKLVLWATRKFKRLRGHRRRASHWLQGVAHRQLGLFAHWRLLYGQAG